MKALRDGGHHIGMRDGRDIAVTLQLVLVEIHRPRDVHRKDEFEVDRLPLRSRRRGGDGQQRKAGKQHATKHGRPPCRVKVG